MNFVLQLYFMNLILEHCDFIDFIIFTCEIHLERSFRLYIAILKCYVVEMNRGIICHF